MKMNSQSRSFARQVQVDLLALNDTDLFHIVHQWVERSTSSGLSTIPEDTRSALGYTRVLAETQMLPHPFHDPLQTGITAYEQWLAPSPQDLRLLIAAMGRPH